MNRHSLFLCIILLITALSGLQAQVNNNGQAIASNVQGDDIFYHTIERGQTVYSIATMYGVSQDDIYRLNPGSKEGIRAGDVLKVPQRDVAVNPVEADDSDMYIYHTIQPKETLYSLSKRYKVQAPDIVRANPGLTVLKYGQTIRIPATRIEELPTTEVKTVRKELEYKVERWQTIYRISRKFNISSAELIRLNPQLKDGLKEGMVLKIPMQSEEIVTEEVSRPMSEREVNALLTETKPVERVDLMKVALLLPFSTTDRQAIPRFVEYYEGLLLAVDSLKNRGCSLELSVYDTGDGLVKVNQILNEPALQEANLIIGAVQNDQIHRISEFAQEKQIKYVIPFTSRNDDVLSNAYAYQVNTPHSYLYANAAKAGCDLFTNDNIIILKIGDKDEKTEFIQAFKGEMEQRNIPHKELSFTRETFVDDIQSLLDSERRNIVLPTSSSLEALNNVRSHLRMLSEIPYNDHPPYSINLFGYPEWQTYTQHALDDLYALNTYIYSFFYADNLSQDVQSFYSNYKNKFSKNLINSFPKYGILGFDTAMFFFDALRQYGANFETNLDKFDHKSLQTGFNFERVNNWGGFINTNVFIVQYRDDYTVVRNNIR
ncbi:LysM repeat protein [Parabacteroides sp. PFB2-10]|uniref:PBP1 and LysM peptidoglycan-binding domain-containing protein n=1 Tax=Parabacteroides sp. PFB2-10 TaxID=1742405 RepID=UPI0024732031|nr:LysM peptidoglycan-binding domain-containing protein [Parabacteroides sp. PFB2-10]MDH6313423.1 LysM repeat protein [Parabacteroides sp. PFB2-10]